MDLPLENTVALVTGASSGIGAATARSLAARGADLALVARRRERLEDLAAEIERETDRRAVVFEADLSRPERPAAVVEEAVTALGRLDLLVNNAGVMLLGPIDRAPASEWDRMFDLNLKAMAATTRAAVPHLLEAAENSDRRCADLVNVSSIAGRVATSGAAVYNATKFGVGAFSESFRQEFARRRLRSAVIEPGVVETELYEQMRPEVREKVLSRIPDFERLHPADVADLIAHVVSLPWSVSVNELVIRPTEQRI